MTDSGRGAIFDVDGVLVDSYDAHLASWMQLARETGVRFTRLDFTATFGQTSREVLRRFWNDRQDDDQHIRQLDDRKESIFRELVSKRFPTMDGAVDLLRQLHTAEWRIALGSSGPPENIELAIDRLKIRPLVNAVVTGREVRRGKPHPEVFLKCAERLGLPPSHCVVVEDAPTGILAARRAGMRVIALLSKGRTENDHAACPPDAMVRSLRELSPAFMHHVSLMTSTIGNECLDEE